MHTQFALDLRLARRKAGFTQHDVAKLIGSQQALVSDLERGRTLPTIEQIVALSQIYGRSFESLFAQLMREAAIKLKDRIGTLPARVRSYVGTFNREASLQRLERRLADNPSPYDGL
jgi:transcriptional regulator with XRE-family HTH domain